MTGAKPVAPGTASPSAWSEETYTNYYDVLSRELERQFGDGQVVLDWTISYITAIAAE